MSITIKCTGCGQPLQVGDSLVGKRVKCPKCQTVAEVPASSDAAAASTENWHLKTPDGQQYGPMPRAQIDAWVAEQRITSDCQLWQEGWESWQWAGSVIPSLAAGLSTATSSYPVATSSHPGDNPYQSPAGTYPGPGINTTRYKQPHRGGVILALGIVGLVACAICGPIAWVMGNTDLRLMRSGQMDPTGEGLTQAGRIMGMISTILMALGFAIWIVMIVLFVVVGVAGNAR